MTLPTNYTDATWEGNRRYRMINNADGTVSFEDVTAYTNKENSFFGAADANAINTALNRLSEGGAWLEIPSADVFSSLAWVEYGTPDTINNVYAYYNQLAKLVVLRHELSFAESDSRPDAIGFIDTDTDGRLKIGTLNSSKYRPIGEILQGATDTPVSGYLLPTCAVRYTDASGGRYLGTLSLHSNGDLYVDTLYQKSGSVRDISFTLIYPTV